MVVQSAVACTMFWLLLTSSNAFLSRNISPQLQNIGYTWNNILQLNMVTTSRLQTSTTEDSEIVLSTTAPFDVNYCETDDYTGPEKIQQFTIANFQQLLGATDIAEFTSLLKQMAAKRRRIPEANRPALSRAVFERLDQFNNEFFSDCVWSIGTLRCNVNDFSSAGTTTQGVDAVSSFWEKVSKVSESADRLCLTRLAIGLGKMGVRWDNLPSSTRVSLTKLIQDENYFAGAAGVSKIIPESRELATILFTLGQLGVTTDLLPEGSLSRVLEEVSQIAAQFTPQGLSNALHGLARMGVLWSDLPPQAQSELPLRGAAIVQEMRPDELCSITQSMAVMKVQWSTLPSIYKTKLLDSLERILPTLNNRELSNVFWALGKTNIRYQEDLSDSFRGVLMDSLLNAAGDLKLFDLESIFVGLGLMQVEFSALSDDTQEYLLRNVDHHLSSMNIFCTYNVLWGLARMGVSTASLGPNLSSSILEKAVNVLHTFLPTQYGDIIWSLGTLGYSKGDLSPVMSDRLLAVLSRVYGKLHVRAAAYTLWGLSKMGFQWDDMRVRTRSLAGGREADPLSESVCKYLRQRVASMKEHEYSVLLYSLGGLGAQLQDHPDHSLPSYVTDKIHHRATRVSTFLTSRSLANSLYGLGKCGVRWMKLPAETRQAWQDAMLRPSPTTTTLPIGGAKGRDSGGDRRGLAGMRNVEFTQTLYGLGQMQVPWKSLLYNAREAILRELDLPGKVDSMDLHGLSSGLWGLSAMGCSLNDIPPTLLAAARSKLWTPVADMDANSATKVVSHGDAHTSIELDQLFEAETRMKINVEESNSIPAMDMMQHRSPKRFTRRVTLTSIEEAGLSLSMGLEAMGKLGVLLSVEEQREISIYLQVLAAQMGSDSIVSCTAGLSQLGISWSDLSLETRVTWIATLKKFPGEMSTAKRQILAESLSAMKAF